MAMKKVLVRGLPLLNKLVVRPMFGQCYLSSPVVCVRENLIEACKVTVSVVICLKKLMVHVLIFFHRICVELRLISPKLAQYFVHCKF